MPMSCSAFTVPPWPDARGNMQGQADSAGLPASAQSGNLSCAGHGNNSFKIAQVGAVCLGGNLLAVVSIVKLEMTWFRQDPMVCMLSAHALRGRVTDVVLWEECNMGGLIA